MFSAVRIQRYRTAISRIRAGFRQQSNFGISRLIVAVVTIALGTAGLITTALPTHADTPVAQPRISVGPDMVVGESVGHVDVPVTLSAPGLSTVTVHYTTFNNTAIAPNSGTDYTGTSGDITFLSGDMSANISVNITNDLVAEPVESFGVKFSAPNGTPLNATIARADTMVTIIDNDTVVTTPDVFVRDAIVDEKAGTVSVPVILGGPAGEGSASTVTVDFTTTNGTALAGSDYATTSGTLSFAPGETVKNVTVSITDDSTAESVERFSVNLTNPTNATIANATSTVIIGANDAATVALPRVSVAPDMVVDEGAGYIDVPVTLSAPSVSVVTANFATFNITAVAPNSGTDYRSSFGYLTFAPGETIKTVRVEILNDLVAEPVESFGVELSAPNGTPLNATIARADTMVTIIDNDTVVPTPDVFVRDAIVDEKAGTVSVPVILGGPTGEGSVSTVTVDFTTTNGTALAGSDYATTSGTLSFAPGETVKNVTVSITDDSTAESVERFSVNLTNPTNATIANATSTVIIGANDAAVAAMPSLSVSAAVVDEGVGYIDIPVTLSAPSTHVVTANFATFNITAVAPNSGTDYRSTFGYLTFAPGETIKTVRVEILNDLVAEPVESFGVKLSAPNGTPLNATIPLPDAATTIIDDDNGLNVHVGGLGNDNYTVAAASDLIVESRFGGTDSVTSSVTYTLPTNVENLTLSGSSPIRGTGNSSNNVLTGNGAANTLTGLKGNDRLVGGAANDTLIGGSGSDTITAGSGTDTIVCDSLVGADTITDFSHADDTFRISMQAIKTGNGNTTVDSPATRNAPSHFSRSSELVVFTSNISGSITTAKAAAKIGSAATAYAKGSTRLFVVDNGSTTAIYRFLSSAANASVSTSELTLIAVVHYEHLTTSTSVSDYKFAA
jgi:Ca2+-binding RTX toxin-like protein